MNIYRLRYQHHKDIVDDNILTVFVLAKKVEDVKHTTYEAYEEAKAKGETYRLEHADTYIS